MNLDLRYLNTFVVVAERKSFIGAAAQLHISQPAITAQIQRLEETVGVQLFDRSRRSVQLTKAGEVFLAGARVTLAHAFEAVHAAQRVSRGETGTLRVGFPPSVLQQILPAIMIEFHRLHPHVKLDLFSLHTSMAIASLQSNSIDIGYVRLPVEARGLQIFPMHREPLVVCLPENHPLAPQREINLKDLRHEKFIVYERKWAPGFHDTLMEMCRNAGFTPIIAQEIDEMYVAPTLVATGVGIAILPYMVVAGPSRKAIIRQIKSNHCMSQIGVAKREADTSALVDSVVSISRIIGKKHSTLSIDAQGAPQD